MCCLGRLLLTSSLNPGDGRPCSGSSSCQTSRRSAGVLPGTPRDPFTATASPSVISRGRHERSLSAACGKRSCAKLHGGGRVAARACARGRGRGQPQGSAGRMEGKRRRKQKSLQTGSKKGNVSLGGLSPHKPSTGDDFSEEVPAPAGPAPAGGGEDHPRPAPLHHPKPATGNCSVPCPGRAPLSRSPPAAPDGLLTPRCPSPCPGTRLAHLSRARGGGTGTPIPTWHVARIPRSGFGLCLAYWRVFRPGWCRAGF